MRRTLIPCLLALLFLSACGTDESGLDELSAPGTSGSGGSSAGQGGSSGGGGGQGGGSSGKGGTSTAGSSGAGGGGGSDAGSGGSGAGSGGSPAGSGGSGGSDAGAGGTAAGSGGSDAGAGGSDAGSGGSDAGSGGSDAGAGGSDAGAGGSDAGSGGSDAGSGGSDAGAGGSDAGAGGSSGSGGSDAGAGGSDAGSGGSAGAGGGPVDCGSGFAEGCDGCLAKSCCAEAAACGPNCKACLLGDVTGKNCANDAEFKALQACSEASCKAECFQGNGGPPVCSVTKPVASGGSCVTTGSNGFNCNPVNNSGCSSAGTACDINNNNNGFTCYGGSNTQNLCGACGQNNYCQPGFTCLQGQCQAYCCDDGDCNGGICDKQKVAGAGKGVVGICSEPLFSGVDLCKADPHEPNNSAGAAKVLAPQDDCSFQNNLVITGSLSPSGDQDWFRADFVDTNQCPLEPIFRFQGNAGIRVCAYFKCKNGATTAGQQVQCSNSDTPSNNSFGPGCCTSDGNLTPQLNCTGDDDSAEVLVRVDTNGSNACLPYRIRYGY